MNQRQSRQPQLVNPGMVGRPGEQVGQQQVITYVPQYQAEEIPADMGAFRRYIWLYTHRLGLEFSLVLMLSLTFQLLVALYLGIRAIRNLPLLSWLPAEPAWQTVGYGAAILAGFFIQALLVAELAQVVWLRRTDRLKVRLMSGSIWWWVHLTVLCVLVLFDFLLLFMSITGATDLGQGWQRANANQMTFVADMLLTLLNLLTLLRCASVMQTSTAEENRRAVEEHIRALADEMLLEAGDSTRTAAQKVWRNLGADPARFLPVQDSVIALIREQHPGLFPAGLGGDTWAYDFTGNNLVALPPDLHTAMASARTRRERFSNHEYADLWGLSPSDLAELIGYNLETMGKPRFVDMTDPDEPQYAYTPVNLRALGTAGRRPEYAAGLAVEASSAPDPASTQFADKQSFLAALGDSEKVRFAGHLKKRAFPEKYGEAWTEVAGIEIWNVFDLLELQWHYRAWAGQVSRQRHD